MRSKLFVVRLLTNHTVQWSVNTPHCEYTAIDTILFEAVVNSMYILPKALLLTYFFSFLRTEKNELSLTSYFRAIIRFYYYFLPRKSNKTVFYVLLRVEQAKCSQ